MVTKAETRRFFFVGTILFTAIFIGLTIHTHTTIASRTNADRLDDTVRRGGLVWGRYNCENCHTLMGEGAYYAPDLTKIVSQRGRPYLRAFMAEPSRFYSEEEDGRLMPTLGMSEQEIDDVISFLEWVGEIDLNGWPPRPILVAGVSTRGLPGVVADESADSPTSRGEAIFMGKGTCAACHAVAPGVTLVGPSLVGVAERARERLAAGYPGEASDVAGYLRESILSPSAYVPPEGAFAAPDGTSFMPDIYANQLSPDEVDDLVAYLQGLD